MIALRRDLHGALVRAAVGAGVDIITDGEVRRLDGYVDSYYAIIQGIEPTQPAPGIQASAQACDAPSMTPDSPGTWM